MFHYLHQRMYRPLVVMAVVALAGCQDLTAPGSELRPQFAQGDAGVWTVNTLADAGVGACDDVECTLREAIAAAQSGDRIVFAPGLEGTIGLVTAELEIEGKTLLIDGDRRITLSGLHTKRVMSIMSLAKVTLRGLTITNGYVQGPANSGGGIFVFSSELVLDDVTVFNNMSYSGSGGGISTHSSSVTLLNSRLVGNHATRGGGLHGFVSGVEVINSTIADNRADEAGGISLQITNMTMTASTVSDNYADVKYGGMFVSMSSSATIQHSTISGNMASFEAGGIVSVGNVVISNSTITRNRSASVGGLMNYSETGVMSVSNSIVAGNIGASGSAECGGPESVRSLGYNLTSLSGGCVFAELGDVTVAPSKVFTEVLDAELRDNGGPTPTHALIVRGHAVDAGYCPATSEDQRGFARPVDDPAMPNARDGCDIGAFELQGPVAVVADLLISQSANKTSVKQGELLTYTVRVQNVGPQDAANVIVNNVISSGAAFVSIRYNRGHHTAPPAGETGTVTWYLGDMPNESDEAAEIEVTVLVRGKTTITNTATVTADVVDPNPANNTASLAVSVASGSSGNTGGGKKK